MHALPSGQLAYFYGPPSEMKPSVTQSDRKWSGNRRRRPEVNTKTVLVLPTGQFS